MDLSIEQLKEKGSDFIREWVNANSLQISLQENFNWLGLAEAMSNLAFAGRQFNVSYLKIAINIYEELAEKEEKSKNSFLISAMYLRIRGLEKDTSLSSEIDFNPNIILEWFTNNSKLSLQEVLAVLDKQSNLTLGEIKELRQLKNRLNVIKKLSGLDDVIIDNEILQMLTILNKLP